MRIEATDAIEEKNFIAGHEPEKHPNAGLVHGSSVTIIGKSTTTASGTEYILVSAAKGKKQGWAKMQYVKIDKVYEIEKVMAARGGTEGKKGKSKREWKIRWVGYGPSHDSWEPIGVFNGGARCPALKEWNEEKAKGAEYVQGADMTGMRDGMELERGEHEQSQE